MRLFTIEEANRLLPTVRPLLLKIQKSHRVLQKFRDAAQHAAAGAELGGGGMVGGSRYTILLVDLSSAAAELDALGVQIKDYSRGLIDFPSLREGRVVLLCWYLGEGDEIEYWHDVETGFAGRQPL